MFVVNNMFPCIAYNSFLKTINAFGENLEFVNALGIEHLSFE